MVVSADGDTKKGQDSRRVHNRFSHLRVCVYSSDRSSMKESYLMPHVAKHSLISVSCASLKIRARRRQRGGRNPPTESRRRVESGGVEKRQNRGQERGRKRKRHSVSDAHSHRKYFTEITSQKIIHVISLHFLFLSFSQQIKEEKKEKTEEEIEREMEEALQKLGEWEGVDAGQVNQCFYFLDRSFWLSLQYLFVYSCSVSDPNSEKIHLTLPSVAVPWDSHHTIQYKRGFFSTGITRVSPM